MLSTVPGQPAVGSSCSTSDRVTSPPRLCVMTSMTSSASGLCVLRRASRSSAFSRRVEAEGLVVEADDCVVRRDRGAQEPLPVLVDAQGPERSHGGRERPVDEQQQPDRSIGRQLELAEVLELAPLLHIGIGKVEEARADVVLHLLDGLLEDRGRDEAEHQCLRSALHQIAEQAPGAPVPRGLGGLAPASWSWLHGDLEPRRPGLLVEGLGALGRVHRQVPGVDAVVLEQHDRVLTGRYVDLQLHVPGLVGGRLPVDVLGLARRQVDPLDLVETCVLERRDEGVLSCLRTASGATRQVPCLVPRGRLCVVRRGRGDAKRAPREGRRHDVNSPPSHQVHVPAKPRATATPPDTPRHALG